MDKIVNKPSNMQKLEKLTFRATFKKAFIVSNPNIKEKTTARREVISTFTMSVICNKISAPRTAGMLIK